MPLQLHPLLFPLIGQSYPQLSKILQLQNFHPVVTLRMTWRNLDTWSLGLILKHAQNCAGADGAKVRGEFQLIIPLLIIWYSRSKQQLPYVHTTRANAANMSVTHRMPPRSCHLLTANTKNQVKALKVLHISRFRELLSLCGASIRVSTPCVSLRRKLTNTTIISTKQKNTPCCRSQL